MAEKIEKNSMILYSSYIEAVEDLPEDEQLQYIKALFNYGLYDEEPTNLSLCANAVFKAIRPTMDIAKERYIKSIENGKKGGRPKKECKNIEDRRDDVLIAISEYEPSM